jgi:hypothetical protein
MCAEELQNPLDGISPGKNAANSWVKGYAGDCLCETHHLARLTRWLIYCNGRYEPVGSSGGTGRLLNVA